MKPYLILLIMSLFVTTSNASVSRMEIKAPYILVGCTNLNEDLKYSLGLKTESVSLVETEEVISFVVTNSLNLCQFEGEKLFWQKVDPFRGYDVSYFDFKKGELSTKREVIVPEVLGNRFDLGMADEDFKMVKLSAMSPQENGSFSGSISFNKYEILNQSDIDLLNDQKEVKKILVLFSNSNVSTFIQGKMIEPLGDTYWSGRNIILTFKKVKSDFLLVKVSL